MRRRQAYHTEEQAVEPEPEQKQNTPAKKGRGHCPKCGKHIGRGVAFHARTCVGLKSEQDKA